jgi:hypothetical protein
MAFSIRFLDCAVVAVVDRVHFPASNEPSIKVHVFRSVGWGTFGTESREKRRNRHRHTAFRFQIDEPAARRRPASAPEHGRHACSVAISRAWRKLLWRRHEGDRFANAVAMPEPPALFDKGGPVAEGAVTETPEGRRRPHRPVAVKRVRTRSYAALRSLRDDGAAPMRLSATVAFADQSRPNGRLCAAKTTEGPKPEPRGPVRPRERSERPA